MSARDPLFGKVYTAKEVARSLRVNISTLRRWTKDGTLQEGVDFFLLPRTGKNRLIRFTEAQYQRIMGNHPSQTKESHP